MVELCPENQVWLRDSMVYVEVSKVRLYGCAAAVAPRCFAAYGPAAAGAAVSKRQLCRAWCLWAVNASMVSCMMGTSFLNACHVVAEKIHDMCVVSAAWTRSNFRVQCHGDCLPTVV